MNKEKLIAAGVSEDNVEKLLRELGETFIPKARFDEVNEGMKAAKETVTERDKQLETLKSATGDIEALRKQISNLQSENEKTKADHEAAIYGMKFDAAVSSALSASKAKNAETVKPLLAAFLKDAKLGEDGIKGLTEAIERVKKDNDYLFEGDTVSKLTGVAPAEGKNIETGVEGTDDFLKGLMGGSS